jgi:hypothetical protein
MPDFEVKEEHLALLRAMNWHWQCGDNGFGAPGVDPEFPFIFPIDPSNPFHHQPDNVTGAVCQVLGEKYARGDLVQEAWAMTLYRETIAVLTIIMATGLVQPGMYRKSSQPLSWYRVGPA